MNDNSIRWDKMRLISIQYSEDLWHVKFILYCLRENGEPLHYELLFDYGNIQEMEIQGQSLNMEIYKFEQQVGTDGGYDITIYLGTGKGEGKIRLTCNDFRLQQL